MIYSWQKIRRTALSNTRELIKAHIAIIAATLLMAPLPLFIPMLVDEVILKQPGPMMEYVDRLLPWRDPIVYIIAMLLLTTLLRLIILALHVYQSAKFVAISKNVTYGMRTNVLKRLQRIAMVEYEKIGGGRVSSHVITDLNTIDEFVGSAISKMVVALLMLVGTAVVLLILHWQLALLIIFLNPVVILFTSLMGKKVKALKGKENAVTASFQEALTETLEAIHQVRASNRDAHYIDRLIFFAGRMRDYSSAFSWKSDAMARGSFTVFISGVDFFRSAAIAVVIYSDLSIGQMLAVFSYLWYMMQPVQDILQIQYSYFAANAALERVNDLCEVELEPTYPAEVDPFVAGKSVGVEIENLSFAYGDGPPVLKNISVSIPKAHKVAIVGGSGGGKSTLIHLLLGLYPASEGRITFGGEPMDKIGLSKVREKVAVVLQNPVLFNDTIENNLSFGEEYSQEQLWNALELAQIADFVRQSPAGLQTHIGRQGLRLSGGQRQRIAIARMVLTDPAVVIFDEATSALDTQTEASLHRDIATFLEGRTTLIVAHRLSAVREADMIYVLDDGRIVDSGSHEELLESKGVYFKLYGPQV